MSELKSPPIGLGTWKLRKIEAKFSTSEALKIGYRHIDTAQAYGNEKYVGEGIEEIIDTGIVKRDELIIATKLHPLNLRPNRVLKSTNSSLKKLKLDYVNILYVHYPAFNLGYSHQKTLGAISKLVDEGQVKNIGISNFTLQMIDDALKTCEKPIYANQIEHHPFLQQEELIKYNQMKGIEVISYSPLGRKYVLENPTIQKIAKENEISAAQVCLAWVISKGAFPIPKATSLNHLQDNFQVKDVILKEEELKNIDNISIVKRFVHPMFVSPKEWKKQ